MESIEPLYRGVGDIFRLEHSVENAKLRRDELVCYAMNWNSKV